MFRDELLWDLLQNIMDWEWKEKVWCIMLSGGVVKEECGVGLVWTKRYGSRIHWLYIFSDSGKVGHLSRGGQKKLRIQHTWQTVRFMSFSYRWESSVGALNRYVTPRLLWKIMTGLQMPETSTPACSLWCPGSDNILIRIWSFWGTLSIARVKHI